MLSRELGTAMASFSRLVYDRNRLPMRVREIARVVIAHDNDCAVCLDIGQECRLTLPSRSAPDARLLGSGENNVGKQQILGSGPDIDRRGEAPDLIP